MSGWVDEWLNKWIGGWMMDGWVDRQKYEWIDRQMDEWMGDRCMDSQTDGYMDGISMYLFSALYQHGITISTLLFKKLYFLRQ